MLESTQNQISGKVDKDRVIVTLGKFAVGDVFDDNVYAHDPTTGFLNFAFNTMGPSITPQTRGVTPTGLQWNGNKIGGPRAAALFNSRRFQTVLTLSQGCFVSSWASESGRTVRTTGSAWGN